MSDQTGDVKNARVIIGFILIFGLLLAIPFLNQYFGDFYRSPLKAFKAWYPHLHFIIFPLVKILPFIAFLFPLWLIRKQLPSLLAGAVTWIATNFRNIAFALLVGCMVLGAAEFVLRKTGFKPGYRIYSEYFHPVDSLILLEGFSADSNGILKVSDTAREFICDELTNKNCTYDLTPIDERQAVNIYTIPGHFMPFLGYSYRSVFRTFVDGLTTYSADSSEVDFIKSIKKYTRCPINTDGFKSIEFKNYITKRKSILLIGDSFTWGHETSNLTNCFADLLLAKGYVVYNTGIEATDPTQYLEVAKRYIPELNPDFVVVNYYIGNDVMYFKRDPIPFIPVFYATNAGNLIACPEGVYFDSPGEAYQYTLAHLNIPKEDSRFNLLCSKTVISTLMWNAITDWKPHWTMSKYEDYYQRIRELKTKTPYSDIQISEIKKITLDNGGKFILIVIPMFDGTKFLFQEDYPEVLVDMKYHIPPIRMEHYEKREDGHYNDSGHAMHAAFIDSLVRNYEGNN